MKNETAKDQISCPREEIAAYIDGELSSREELDLEQHLAVCPTCLAELNEQKKLLSALNFALEDENEIELPENFTRIVVANAESNVKGLRCPRERNRAIFVCIALFLLIAFGLGAESSNTFGMIAAVGERTFAVGGFFVHLISDITIAFGVILRSICLPFVFKSTLTIVMTVGSFLLSLFLFSRLLSRRSLL
jgi:predicted anti-sigma-YlaC factor YlaD